MQKAGKRRSSLGDRIDYGRENKVSVQALVASRVDVFSSVAFRADALARRLFRSSDNSQFWILVSVEHP